MNNFRIVFNSDKAVKNLLYTLSNHTLTDNKTKYSMAEWKKLIGSYLSKGYNDEKIYKKLRLLYSKDISFSDLGRAAYLASNLITFLPKNKNYNTLLDYGCANGAITRELYKQLNINPKNVYGSDISTYDNTDFNFIHVNTDNKLSSIKSGSIDLITCSMVLHHIVDLNSALQELRRVISPNGILIVREHDCQDHNFSAFLDIIHGLYSLVWSEPIEDPNFIKEFKSYYKDSNEWTTIISSFNFTKISEDKNDKSNMKAYYSVYKVNNT